jgi:hypothetical protein
MYTAENCSTADIVEVATPIRVVDSLRSRGNGGGQMGSNWREESIEMRPSVSLRNVAAVW